MQEQELDSTMSQEIKVLEDNATWEIINLPVSKRAIGSKWVFKIKYKANGEIEIYKDRLVAKGYSQQEGFDYHETFSPVAKMRKYALQLILEARLAATKPISTPIELNQKLITIDYDKHVGVKGDAEPEDIGSYQRLIGKLLYIIITRPDLSFAVQVLSQFMQQPKQSHWDAALRVVRYGKSASGLGMLLSTGPINNISAYCDSDWFSCPNTRRSII
ncbi:uncharacterized mitochondrial protein AtMg00810-like [Nicotiana sylvestris]|uniref:uncharacterized mitochondrial protein AtMg00810-like n=1 Tax=Nicotiana sylvestris TaxID=4096 RepID=UPI00388C40EF